MYKYLDIKSEAFNDFVSNIENFCNKNNIRMDTMIEEISNNEIEEYLDSYDKENSTSFNNTIYGMLFNQLYDHYDMVEADENIVKYNSDPSDFLYNKEEMENKHRKHFNMDVIDSLDDFKADLVRKSIEEYDVIDIEGYQRKLGDVEIKEVKEAFENIPFMTQEVFKEQHEWLVTLNSDVKPNQDTVDSLESMKNKEIDVLDLMDYTKDAFQPNRGDGSDGNSFNDQIDCLITQVKQKKSGFKKYKI